MSFTLAKIKSAGNFNDLDEVEAENERFRSRRAPERTPALERLRKTDTHILRVSI